MIDNELDLSFEDMNNLFNLYSLGKSEFDSIHVFNSYINTFKLIKKTKNFPSKGPIDNYSNQDKVYIQSLKIFRALNFSLCYLESINSKFMINNSNLKDLLIITNQYANYILSSSYSNQTAVNSHDWKIREFNTFILQLFDSFSIEIFTVEDILKLIDLEINKAEKKMELNFGSYSTMFLICKIILLFNYFSSLMKEYFDSLDRENAQRVITAELNLFLNKFISEIKKEIKENFDDNPTIIISTKLLDMINTSLISLTFKELYWILLKAITESFISK